MRSATPDPAAPRDPTPTNMDASRPRKASSTLQVLLDKAGTEVNVDLYQRRVADYREAVDLTGLDNKDIPCTALEGRAVDRPHSAAFADELDLIIRVPVRTRSTGTLKQRCHPARRL